jgi:hypothetical protein
VTDGDEGPPNTRPLLYVVEIPIALLGLFLVWDSSTRGVLGLGGAVLLALAAFALGFLIVAWLYRFARRRVENQAKPRQWEFWLERYGWFFLPPAVGFGMWASQFGANDGWGSASGGAVSFALAGLCHGLVFLTPPEIPEWYGENTPEDR